MPVIYVDVLLALNLYIDFLLLEATARLLRAPHRRRRLALGAVAGAFSSLLALFPELPGALLVFLKITAALVIIRVAFCWQGPRGYIKQIVVFFVISTAFAGVSFALFMFAAPHGFYVLSGTVYYDVSPVLLIILTGLSYILIRLYDRFIRKKEPLGREYTLHIKMGDKTVKLRALYDSGNSLTEPFSGEPAAVAEYEGVKALLTPDWREAVRSAWTADLQTPAAPGLRMISYRSVGGDGLLYAFKPNRLTLSGIQSEKDVTGAYIAVCKTLGRGEYQALVGTDIINEQLTMHN